MIVVITGSRDWKDHNFIEEQLTKLHKEYKFTKILSGNCPTGVDNICEIWALMNDVPVELHPARFDLYGKQGGYIRNNKMTQEADMLIGFCKSETSVGTEMTIRLMREKKKPCVVFYIPL
jgi:hypothetical protein